MATGDGVYRILDHDILASEEEKKTSSASHGKLPTPRFKQSKNVIFWAAVAAAQVVAILCVSLIFYWVSLYGGFGWSSDAKLQFNYHPVFMVLGLVILNGEAIILYRVFSFLPKLILKVLHAALHLGAIILASIALVAIFEYHRRENRADLYSLHSWVGLATCALFFLQFTIGFISFLFPGMPASWRIRIMPFHTFFGIGILAMAIASCQMGLTERLIWTGNYTTNQNIPQGTIGNSLGLFLIIFGFLIAFLATNNRYKRRPLPSESASIQARN